ncbi:MAG TPA: hypothetical protein DCQ87_02825 [Lachnospiraceae bacterium]|nr:hypothetical protein [Lachnospiraceae bacterium]
MNSKRQNLEYTARIICKAAGPYKSNLIGRKFLYIFDNRYIEVIYKTNNFKHLTGVESELSAKDFFKLAKRGKLSYKNIYFSSTHPFQLSMKKLKHLNDIVKLSTSESFMLEEIKTNTKTYKFGTTDLNFTLCFNQLTDAYENSVYHVESLRDGDCFSKSRTVYNVNAILYKKNDSKTYDHCAFLDKNFKFDDIPNSVRKLCTDDLLTELSKSQKT